MSPSAHDRKCDVCGGPLAAPDTTAITEDSSRATRPDYRCATCRRPYNWRGDPPRLVLSSRPGQ
jgi:hypothetical protein